METLAAFASRVAENWGMSDDAALKYFPTEKI